MGERKGKGPIPSTRCLCPSYLKFGMKAEARLEIVGRLQRGVG